MLPVAYTIFLSSLLSEIDKQRLFEDATTRRGWEIKGHQLQGLIHLLMDCLASEPLRSPPLAVLLPFLISGSALEAWPDCWVSVEFLRTLLGRSRVAPLPEWETTNINLSRNLVCYKNGALLKMFSTSITACGLMII